jgi:hypothetical protein
LTSEYIRSKKILNGPNGILWGWGETDSCKKTRSENSRDTVPLKGPLGEKTLLSITSKTIGGYYLKSVEIIYFLQKIVKLFFG